MSDEANKVFLSGACYSEDNPLYLTHFLEAHAEMELMGYEVYNHTQIEWGKLDWLGRLLARLVILEQCDAIYLIGHKGEWRRNPDSYIEFLVAREMGLDILSQEEKPRNIGGKNDPD